MYSQFPFDGEDSHHASKVRFLKSMTLGFGAGLLLGTVVTRALLLPSLPETSAVEPSSLIASPFPSATGSSVASDRGAVIAHGWRFTNDGRYYPQYAQNTAVMENTPAQGGFSQPYQQPSSAHAQYSPEQLEFLQRAGKMPSMGQQYQQSASSQPTSAQGQYSQEQLDFLRRAGKLPSAQQQHQQPTSAQGQYTESQLEFMRRKMEAQYQHPVTTSWDAPAGESVGRRDGYRSYHGQKFS